MVKNRNSPRGRIQRNDDTGELVFKEDGQEYAHVLRIRNDSCCEAICTDGTKRLCYMYGPMHKKRQIAAGDIILVSLRNYRHTCSEVLPSLPVNENIVLNKNAADVILKYTPDNLRFLKAVGELPEIVKLSEEGIARDDGYIDLGDGDIVI